MKKITILLLSLLSASIAHAQCFSAFQTNVLGTPVSIAKGDFNGDGKQDVITANGQSNNISVMLSNGTGIFTNLVYYNSGTKPVSAVVCDFDGDTKLDIAVANELSNNIYIFKGSGTGTFTHIATYNTGTWPQSISAGDANGDGIKDFIATANFGSSSITILAFTNSGIFSTPSSINLSSNPNSLTIGDFNGDTKADIASINQSSNSVTVLIGNGSNSFVFEANYNVGISPISSIAYDFDGNGKDDLAVANENISSNSVSILMRGASNTSFNNAINYSTGTQPHSLAIADINGDFIGDIITLNATGDLSVLIGSGQGLFTAPYSINYFNIEPYAYPLSVVTTDINADNRIDVIVIDGNGSVISLLNGGSLAVAYNVIGCPGTPINLLGTPAGGTFSISNPYTGPATTYTYTYVDPSSGCISTSAPATVASASLTPPTLNPVVPNIYSAFISWLAVTGISNFDVRYKLLSSSTWTSGTIFTNSKYIVNLQPCLNYEVQVRTICPGNIAGPWSASTIFTTLCSPCTLPPTSIVVSNLTANSLTLSWPSVSGASYYGTRYKKSSLTTWTVGQSTTNSKIYTGLTASTCYDFQVNSYCTGQYNNTTPSLWSSTVTFCTPAFKELSSLTSQDNSNFVVYPNPTSDVLNVELGVNHTQITEVKLFDMSGRLVKEISSKSDVGTQRIEISLTQLASGIYTTQIFENGNLTHVTKVEKRD